jgi:hypothetical protein
MAHGVARVCAVRSGGDSGKGRLSRNTSRRLARTTAVAGPVSEPRSQARRAARRACPSGAPDLPDLVYDQVGSCRQNFEIRCKEPQMIGAVSPQVVSQVRGRHYPLARINISDTLAAPNVLQANGPAELLPICNGSRNAEANKQLCNLLKLYHSVLLWLAPHSIDSLYAVEGPVCGQRILTALPSPVPEFIAGSGAHHRWHLR